MAQSNASVGPVEKLGDDRELFIPIALAMDHDMPPGITAAHAGVLPVFGIGVGYVNGFVVGTVRNRPFSKAEERQASKG